MIEIDNHPYTSREKLVNQILKEREVKGYTVSEICTLKEKPWTWVVRRLAPLKSKLTLPVEIRNIKDLFVPRDVYIWIDFIDETDVPSEDWITTTGMADELYVNYKWVNRRILDLESTGEFRIGSNGSRLHFPPEALDELQSIRNRSLLDIDYEKYVNLSQLAEIIGRHRLWINNRLDNIQVDPILALDNTGKAVEFYPMEIVNNLINQRDMYEDGGNRLTIPMLADTVQKDREWVERQLEELGSIGEYRHFQKSGRIDLCFNTETLHELLRRAHIYTLPEPGWYTANTLQNITGKSSNWIRRQLSKLNTETRWFLDSQGVPRKHYSPKITTHLPIIDLDWDISRVVKSSGERGIDEIEQLRKIVGYGKTMSFNTLIRLGLTKKQIREWTKIGVVTRWKNKQFYVTKKAEVILHRVDVIEQEFKRLDEMKLFIE